MESPRDQVCSPSVTRVHQASDKISPRQPFEWHAADGALHALGYQRYRPCPDDTVTTLCGNQITLTHEDFRRSTRHPMCVDCLHAWQRHQEK